MDRVSSSIAVPEGQVRTVYGQRPSHVHTCPNGNHRWECNSPYCEVLDAECPDHGGLTPIIQGREPWRGRL
jgi:hypothetical protein